MSAINLFRKGAVDFLLVAFAASAFAQTPPQRPPAPPPYNCEPSNPNATREARALLKTLCAVSGKGILTGQHNFPNQRAQDTDKIYGIAGKYPAIWGSDFGFTDGEDKDSILHRDLMIAEAKKQADDTIAKVFVSGADGFKVGFDAKTEHWTHKGMPKHEVPMTGETWIGPVKVDDSTGLQLIQVGLPVLDGGKPIGSIVVGLRVDKLR